MLLLREKPSSLSGLPNLVHRGGPRDAEVEPLPALETRRSMCSGCLYTGKEAAFSTQTKPRGQKPLVPPSEVTSEASGSLLHLPSKGPGKEG